MILNKIIVHELKKESGKTESTLITSEETLPVNTDSIELIETLLKSYSGDKIHYAIFDQSPGKYFPNRFNQYTESDRNKEIFIKFTLDIAGNLSGIIKSKTLAKGGYLVIADYKEKTDNYLTVFLIRDTEGKLLKKSKRSFTIHRIDYLDTNNLAMACRIDESKLNIENKKYLSFTQVKQQEVSDYFMEWICASQLESSKQFTDALYKIINALPTPKHPVEDRPYTIDEVRNMVYENAINNAQRNIDLRILSNQIYGDADVISNYVTQNDIAIDSEFRFNRRALRKFIQVHINQGGINLKFSRGDIDEKVYLSDDKDNIVIIESEEFAAALRRELSDND